LRLRRDGYHVAVVETDDTFQELLDVLKHAADYFPSIKPGRVVTYTVKRGDTLELVAKRHGVSIPSLRVANGIRAASTG